LDLLTRDVEQLPLPLQRPSSLLEFLHHRALLESFEDLDVAPLLALGGDSLVFLDDADLLEFYIVVLALAIGPPLTELVIAALLPLLVACKFLIDFVQDFLGVELLHF
jgi:hypothetical protein